MNPGIRKSLYLFLTSILGALLFLVLQRVVVSLYLTLLQWKPDVFSFGLSFMEITAIDLINLTVAVLFGAWYGIWIGMHWYYAVYEQAGGRGFVWGVAAALRRRGNPDGLKSEIESAARRMERETWRLERLSNPPIAKSSRRVVRRRAL
jgi:hypothetical protein